MPRSILPFLCAGLLVAGQPFLAPVLLPGVESEEKKVLRLRAEDEMNKGKRLQDLFNSEKPAKPSTLINAALAFGQAHDIYEKLGDTDATVDAQASLYWCRKQMTVPVLQEFNRRRNGGGAAAQAKPEGGATPSKTEEPAKSPAEVAFAKAETFAKEHPDDLKAIAQSWAGVARRYSDTESGREAAKRATAALEAFATKLRSGEIVVPTRFMVTHKAEPGKGMAVPSEADQKRVQADLRKTYAALWSKRALADRRKLMDKLNADIGKQGSDAALVYTALNEVAKIAQEVEDYSRLLDAFDRLGDKFEGIDAKAQATAALKRSSGKVVVQAFITLLGDPKDKYANAVAGRTLAMGLGQWTDGLALIINGNEADLRAVAVEDYLDPAQNDAMLKVGDGWYALSKKKSEKDLKMGCLTRAQFWYQKAVTSLAGTERERVQQTLADIEKLLPMDMDNINWSAITEAQWNRIKATTVTVEMRLDRTTSGVVLRPGDQVRVVPHPTDRWTIQARGWGPERTFTYQGRKNGDGDVWYGDGYQAGVPYGSLCMVIGNGKRQVAGIAVGPGALWFEPNRPSDDIVTMTGSIRVKLVPLADD